MKLLFMAEPSTPVGRRQVYDQTVTDLNLAGNHQPFLDYAARWYRQRRLDARLVVEGDTVIVYIADPAQLVPVVEWTEAMIGQYPLYGLELERRGRVARAARHIRGLAETLDELPARISVQSGGGDVFGSWKLPRRPLRRASLEGIQACIGHLQVPYVKQMLVDDTIGGPLLVIKVGAADADNAQALAMGTARALIAA